MVGKIANVGKIAEPVGKIALANYYEKTTVFKPSLGTGFVELHRI